MNDIQSDLIKVARGMGDIFGPLLQQAHDTLSPEGVEVKCELTMTQVGQASTTTILVTMVPDDDEMAVKVELTRGPNEA